MTVAGESHLRGHLFADLRGSTAFTERAGNAAGAALVSHFRQLVRDEVGKHEGAEVMTEGDAIYVVFPSASSAVMCGLAIIAKAAEASAADPDLPIPVGVGVHAGEAVAVAEGGYIGSAVNLAARVCAVAGAGELLVTGTVRSIAQQSIPVTFVARGKRRLKGIADPVELYLVVPEGATVQTGRNGRRLVAGIGAALAVVLAGAFVVLFVVNRPPPTPPTQTRTPVQTPTPLPPVVVQPHIGPLEIGQYQLAKFQPRFDFAIVDPGWSFTDETSSKTSLLHESDAGNVGTVDVGKISTVYTSPCIAGGENLPTVSTSQDLLDGLRAQESFLHVNDPQPIFVGDSNGLILDVNIDPGVLAACDGAGDVAVFQLGGTPFTAAPGTVFRVYVFDVGASNVAFVASSNADPDTSVSVIENFFGLARRMVDSVKF